MFNTIRQDIESGRLAVGSKLSSEATLSQQYGVSRSVIREALRSCTALGLTVTKTGKGTFVVANKVANDLTLGQYSARDLTEARPHIEVPAAGLAAERRTGEELETLRNIVAAMATLLMLKGSVTDRTGSSARACPMTTPTRSPASP